MKKLFIAAALFSVAALSFSNALAEESYPFKVFIGANAVTFDGSSDRLPADFEAGATARASLSPHISVVGSAFKGIARDYLRGAAGFRLTATDVDNPDFSIGLGLQYQTSNRPDLRPREFAPDASIGWRPMPQKYSAISIVGQGSYGLDSRTLMALVGLRYALTAF